MRRRIQPVKPIWGWFSAWRCARGGTRPVPARQAAGGWPVPPGTAPPRAPGVRCGCEGCGRFAGRWSPAHHVSSAHKPRRRCVPVPEHSFAQARRHPAGAVNNPAFSKNLLYCQAFIRPAAYRGGQPRTSYGKRRRSAQAAELPFQTGLLYAVKAANTRERETKNGDFTVGQLEL